MTPIEFLSVTVSRRPLLGSSSRDGPDVRDAPGVVVSLRGEHDLSTVAVLSETMAWAIAVDDADVVVDLSQVEFMGAATVGVLVWARELLRVRSRSLLVRSPSRCARRVMELCGDTHLLDPVEAASLSEVAGALGTWVPVPATDPADHPPATFPLEPASAPDPIKVRHITAARAAM